MKTVLAYLRPYRRRMAAGFTVKVIATLTELLLPYILSHILKNVVAFQGIPQILLWGGAMVVFAAIGMVGNIVANRMAERVTSTFSEQPETAALLDGEQLLVQGVIDLFFMDKDGRLVLCDYKTDHLTPSELADPALAQEKLTERHGTQLSYYAAALHRMCGRRPDRIVIYSLPLGREIDIPVNEI